MPQRGSKVPVPVPANGWACLRPVAEHHLRSKAAVGRVGPWPALVDAASARFSPRARPRYNGAIDTQTGGPNATQSGSQAPGKQLGFLPLDRPEWLPAARSNHVRDDDIVFGFLAGGDPYCVPFFIIDYYHTVNGVLAAGPIVLVSCDRCGSAGAWWARAPSGHALSFQNWGILEGQLLWRDRETHTIWSHALATGVDGELAGVSLKPVGPVLHTTFGEWRSRHGRTLVLTAADDHLHRDLRHGHGRLEVFERPGIGVHDHEQFLATISQPWDERLPEQEMVLGVAGLTAEKAYPWRALKHAGNVVNDDLGGLSIVAWCDTAPDSAACCAFERRVDGRVVEFAARDGFFTDVETDSRWTLEGLCVDGPSAGALLRTVPSVFERWFSWSSSHPQSTIFSTPRARPGSSGWGINTGPLTPVLDALRCLPNRIGVKEQIVRAAYPQGCQWGVAVVIDGHPFRCWAASTEQDARDLCAWPREYRIRLPAIRSGRFVLEDALQDLWTDWTHTYLRRGADVPWSPLLHDERVRDAFAAGSEAAGPHTGRVDAALIDVVDALERGGHPVDTATRLLLPPSAREPGCEIAAEIFVGDDRMILYRYESESSARVAALRFEHSLASETFVLRSTPLNMYRLRGMQMAMRPAERIAWSVHLRDETFVRDFHTAVREARSR
jgi:hypothetical protein